MKTMPKPLFVFLTGVAFFAALALDYFVFPGVFRKMLTILWFVVGTYSLLAGLVLALWKGDKGSFLGYSSSLAAFLIGGGFLLIGLLDLWALSRTLNHVLSTLATAGLITGFILQTRRSKHARNSGQTARD